MSNSILTDYSGMPRCDLLRRLKKMYKFYPVKCYAVLIGETAGWTEAYLRTLEQENVVEFQDGKLGPEVKLTVEGRLQPDGTLRFMDQIRHFFGWL
jgi:hypothetical protein